MKMTKSAFLLAATSALAPLSAALAGDVTYSEWDPNGSGSWSDASRWKGGILPSASGNVLINGADAYVTDADYSILTGLTQLKFQGDASLDMRFDEDHLDFSINSVTNETANSGGSGCSLVKSGSGTLVHSSLQNGFSVDRLVVANGTLKLDVFNKVDVAKTIVFGAYAPGRLVFNAKPSDSSTVDIKGLVGDGTVTNATSATQCRIFGGTSSALEFSGTLEGRLDITTANGDTYQDFTGPDDTVSRMLKLFGGVLGVKSFGLSGSSGTLGPGSTFCWLQGGGVRYLGSGETTDKTFMFGDQCAQASFDAGSGNVTFSGEWNIRGLVGSAPVYLQGTNSDAATWSGSVNALSTNVIGIVKQGTGTWRLAGLKGDGLGTISVEEGTLEYASVSNKGISCSLGRATRLVEPTYGTLASLTSVPWAVRLGTHSTTGTFAYVGSDDVSCTSRLVAVRGTGIVRSDTSAALHYVGATSYDARGGTLVLDGSGGYDNFSDVTNGVGALAVEKRGEGTWTLGGDVDLAGGVSVKGGTLHIANGRHYRWFRYTVKKLWDDNEPYLQISQFGLYDSSGNQQNLNLSVSDESKARAFTLSAGKAAWNHAYIISGDGRDLDKLFMGLDKLMSCGRGAKVYPSPNDSSTWISFTMRLADDAAGVMYYDVKSHQGYTSTGMYKREPKSWMLEGSLDGRAWVVLDEKTFTSNPISGDGNSKRWYSCNQTSHDAEHLGYPIGGPSARNVTIGSVHVAPGATLVADDVVTVSNVVVSTSGGGTLRNFALAQDGSIDFVDTPNPEGVFVPMAFENVSGLENLGGWTVSVNGVASRRWRVGGSAGGIRLTPLGMILVFR